MSLFSPERALAAPWWMACEQLAHERMDKLVRERPELRERVSALVIQSAEQGVLVSSTSRTNDPGSASVSPGLPDDRTDAGWKEGTAPYMKGWSLRVNKQWMGSVIVHESGKGWFVDAFRPVLDRCLTLAARAPAPTGPRSFDLSAAVKEGERTAEGMVQRAIVGDPRATATLCKQEQSSWQCQCWNQLNHEATAFKPGSAVATITEKWKLFEGPSPAPEAPPLTLARFRAVQVRWESPSGWMIAAIEIPPQEMADWEWERSTGERASLVWKRHSHGYLLSVTASSSDPAMASSFVAAFKPALDHCLELEEASRATLR